MGKGQVWINGQSVGRYWPAYKASGTCGSCDYAGSFNEKKCLRNCGEPSQRWYVQEPAFNFFVKFNFLPSNCILLKADKFQVSRPSVMAEANRELAGCV